MALGKKKLGKRYKDLRAERDTIEKDCTQEILQSILGISKPQISTLENGREPSVAELKKYSSEFNVPMEYLLGLSNSRNYQYTDVSKTLGLSEATIKTLKDWVENEQKCNLVEVLNFIFESRYGGILLENLRRYFFAEAEKFIVYDDDYDKNISKNSFDFKMSTSTKAVIKQSESKTMRICSKNHKLDEYIELKDIESIFQINLYNVLSEIKHYARAKDLENTIDTFAEGNFEDGLINEGTNKNG